MAKKGTVRSVGRNRPEDGSEGVREDEAAGSSGSADGTTEVRDRSAQGEGGSAHAEDSGTVEGRRRLVDGREPPTPDPLKDGPPAKKPRRGRKSDAEKAQEAVDTIQAEKAARRARASQYVPAVVELVAWPFDVVAARRGAFWKLTPQESQRLAMSLSVVVEKWLPDFMLRFEEEIALGIILGAVLIGRVREDNVRETERAKLRARGNGSSAFGQDNALTQNPDATT